MKENVMRAVVIAFGLSLVLSPLYRTSRASSAKEEYSAQKNVDASLLFNKHCATCHGKDGRSKTFKAKFDHARNLTDATWQSEASDERIFNSISNGKGKMPAWGKKLSEAEINALVAYVRKLKK